MILRLIHSIRNIRGTSTALGLAAQMFPVVPGGKLTLPP